jgi:uncharacterized protein (TIGR03435 family)
MRLTILLVLAAALASAQPASQLRFEVATIKLNTSGETSSDNDLMAAYVTFRNYTLRALVRIAFSVDDLLLEAPAWLGDLRFDITAKVPVASATLDERRQMMRVLLYDRFALAVHHKSVTRDGFALVLAKGGARIAPVEDVGSHMNDMRDGNVKMVRTTMDSFAYALSSKLRQPVLDETKLTGVFNVTLTYTPDRGASPSTAEDGPSIFTALEQQLGLKLESRKLPGDMLVVDHCEKTPTEN